MLFLSLHALAAKRGDGLHPELRALFERLATAPHSEVTARSEAVVQSGPDPMPRKRQGGKIQTETPPRRRILQPHSG
jgi:hypothetical protein